jgi:hypothetical protein
MEKLQVKIRGKSIHRNPLSLPIPIVFTTRLGETAALQQVEDLIARGRLAVQRVVVLTKGQPLVDRGRSGVNEQKIGRRKTEKSFDFRNFKNEIQWQNVVFHRFQMIMTGRASHGHFTNKAADSCKGTSFMEKTSKSSRSRCGDPQE